MSFVDPNAYDRYMGRYSSLLAPQMADLAGVAAGQRALDVGCGPGALTGELVARLGPESVSAVDPSEPFVAAIRERFPGVEVQVGSAADLPFPDQAFDVSLAQLVVHFMGDPVAGLSEMRRVTRRDGVVAACVWDYAGDRGPLTPFWEAAREFDSEVDDESDYPGVREGHLGELFRDAGIGEVEETALTVAVEHPSFEDWWEPFTLGVGPAGRYLSSLDPDQQLILRDASRDRLPPPPFEVTGLAWAVRGIA